MSLSRLPNIWGDEWSPSDALVLQNEVNGEAARLELLRFTAERHDGHLQPVSSAWSQLAGDHSKGAFDGEAWHGFSSELVLLIGKSLALRLGTAGLEEHADLEVIPRRDLRLHLERRARRFLIDLRLALRRIAHYHAIGVELRLEWQRQMLATRAVDEHLKSLFMEGLETPDGGRFGGKGFRSTWQEAVVAVASALNRDGRNGDRVAPMIRDMGLSLAMGDTPLAVMAAQMGKVGSPMDGGQDAALAQGGRDLHIGAWDHGVLPPTAPLPIASATLTGLALAAQRLGEQRFHVAMIGEGASSSGEWWEALNFAGARGLPICYVLQNNQIALDTPVTNQSGVELWADKALAMGIPSWTIDGSDPAAYHSSVAAAREFALEGGGPVLIHVETMRGCGHAHHHDDLYLGAASGNPPGYVDRVLLDYWAGKDPIDTHAELLLHLGVDQESLDEMGDEEQDAADDARYEVTEMDWPDPDSLTLGITSIHDADTHDEHLDRLANPAEGAASGLLASGESTLEFSDEAGSWTYARAIQQAMVKIAEMHGDSTVFMGEDMEVAGAFGMNLPLKNAGHGDKLLDMPLSESIIIHAATGAALGGLHPMAEIQFGGFAALAFNALVNNAAMLRWRWGAEVPLTVRIPLGGRTRSGPFHANIIESWFVNDPGLILLAPATPQDAYDLLVEAASLPDPVVFLEHIGLYGLRGGLTGWGGSISQMVDTESVEAALAADERHEIGRAAVVRGGDDVTLVTWGAMLHVCLAAASSLAEQGIEAEVIDLRTLIPFDARTLVESVARTGHLVIVQESQWLGGLGHTIQSRILEEAFWSLEAPPLVLGALDTPVPFSPPLEDHMLVDESHIVEAISSMLQAHG